jgi:hypothetical protein
MSTLRNKSIAFRCKQFLHAWKAYAPNVELAGFHIDQLAADADEALLIRHQIEEARTIIAGLIIKRDLFDQVINTNLGMIVDAVRGAPQMGYDCPLYRALGYIPKSEQRRGRPRKAKP